MQQLTSNITFNLIALGLAGGCGILFNLLVSFLFGTQSLGLVSQVYSLLIIFGQIGVFGVQFTAQTLVASSASEEERRKIIFNAIMLSAVTSSVVSLIFYFLADVIADIQSNPHLRNSIQHASIGLFFFCMNKVILGALNGLVRMRAFATLQLLRAMLMLAVAYTLYLMGTDVDKISYIFSYSEVIVFCVGFFVLQRQNAIMFSDFDKNLFRSHFYLGLQNMPAGLLIEMNTKVDVLMLGYFVSDKEVGMFSMAATFAEGLSMILNVLRSNFNPLMAKFYVSKNNVELKAFILSYKSKIAKGMWGIGLISLLAYWGIGFLSDNSDWKNSFVIYCILLLGVILISRTFPFLALIVQAGKPSWFSVAILVGILTNFLLNIVLIPWLGTTGAAISTALSGIVNVFVTVLITNRVLKYKFL